MEAIGRDEWVRNAAEQILDRNLTSSITQRLLLFPGFEKHDKIQSAKDEIWRYGSNHPHCVFEGGLSNRWSDRCMTRLDKTSCGVGTHNGMHS